MRLYFDWNATAPPLDSVLDAMNAAAREAWGNPSSIHAHGRAARARVEDAREAVAELAGGDARDVLLTGGGTEANNLGLRSPFVKRTGVLVTSRIEHPSITKVAEALEKEGRARVRWLRVLCSGRIDLEDLDRALAGPDVALLAMQAVNAESGVVQPVREAIELARKRGVRVHVDAVQAYGKIAEVAAEADTRALAAHKFRGPKGIGALVSLCGVPVEPVLLGGSQERGLRPGTVDPIAAAGLAAAARHAKDGPARYAKLSGLRDDLQKRLLELAPNAVVVGGDAPRAPHVLNMSFPGWLGPELVAALDLEGVSVSSGSACSAGTVEPSGVVTAMLGPEVARGALRMSMGETTTREDVDRLVDVLGMILARAKP
jgi:cysteine desulfurase